MSRTRTLQLLLVASATAWVMILGAVGGMIAMHVFDGPRTAPRASYEHVYRQTATHTMQRHGCCPPPCCPRGRVAHTTPPSHAPWPFLLTGLLAASALVAGLVSRRRLSPMQP